MLQYKVPFPSRFIRGGIFYFGGNTSSVRGGLFTNLHYAQALLQALGTLLSGFLFIDPQCNLSRTVAIIPSSKSIVMNPFCLGF